MERQRGMKSKQIAAMLAKKFDEFVASIDDKSVRDKVERETIITGGSIASMLLGEPVNDFDLYFESKETAVAVAEYYVAKFSEANNASIKVDAEGDRVRIVTANGHRGETAGDVVTLTDSGDIEDAYEDTKEKARTTEDGKPAYRPVFLSTNAITLSDKVQLVLRFFGSAETIHENYDFVHCTNYWTSKDRRVVLRQASLESLLARELRYVGSRYPVCSVIRLRKFIARGWVINAGQILKMLMHISSLDLTNPQVLEDQLTGVDAAYFLEIMQSLKEKDPEKVNAAYLVEIIDRMF